MTARAAKGRGPEKCVFECVSACLDPNRGSGEEGPLCGGVGGLFVCCGGGVGVGVVCLVVAAFEWRCCLLTLAEAWVSSAC